MPGLSSPSEIIRRADLLFRNVDKLEELTLSLLSNPKKKDTKDLFGNVLRSLDEIKIRKICGEVIYRAGLQGFPRVSEKKFAENTLLGKIDARGKNGIQLFQPSISLERKNSSKIHTYGECQCTLAAEGSLCPHIAALMIAWVRKPKEFEEDLESLKSKFEKTRQRVMVSLEELLHSVETSSSNEALDLLQKIYSNIRRWGNEIKDAGDRETSRELENYNPLREFSATINRISLAIIFAIDHKYKLNAIEIYNRATLTTLGKVLELFVENTRYDNKSSQTKNERKVPRQKTGRSWDMLIENFAKGC